MILIDKTIAIETQIKLLTFDFIKNLAQGKIKQAFAVLDNEADHHLTYDDIKTILWQYQKNTCKDLTFFEAKQDSTYFAYPYDDHSGFLIETNLVFHNQISDLTLQMEYLLADNYLKINLLDLHVL